MPRPITLEPEPTLFGVSLVRLMVAALLTAALLNGQRHLALLCVLVLVITGAARLWSRFAAHSILITDRLDKDRVFAGERVMLRVEVRNQKLLPARIRIGLAMDDNLIDSVGNRVFESGILWHETLVLESSLTPVKRGIYAPGRREGTVSDLLGFFPRSIEPESLPELIVYPRIHSITAMEIPRQELFGTPGRRSPVQDPVYLAGTRPYEARVPARFIHWKASARRQILQEKLFQPSEQEKVLIAFQTDGFAGKDREEDFERAVELAASLAVFLARKGTAVGLATDGHVRGTPWARIGRGPGHIAQLLERLASIRPGKGLQMEESITSAIKTGRGITCLHLLLPGEGLETGMDKLASRRRMPLLRIYCGPGGQRHKRPKGPFYKEMDIREVIPGLRQRTEEATRCSAF